MKSITLFTVFLSSWLIFGSCEGRDYEYHCNYSCCENNGKQCYGRDCQHAHECGYSGVWLPEDPPLFRPFVADPRQLTYSAGWRFNDRAINKNVIDVSFFDSLGFYRWCSMWPFGGEMQIGIDGGLWAIFDPFGESMPLVNADYYVGIPLTYRCGKWSFRLHFYHISSHIGDEFLLQNPDFDRKNPSAEYLEFFASYDWTEEIRVYYGLGYVVSQDESFECDRFYTEGGVELRIPKLGFVCYPQNIFGAPFFGMHYRYRGDYKNHVDATYVLGYEFGKLCGLCRKLRLFVEYHDGYSSEGQFCQEATNYFSVRGEYSY